MFLFNPAGYAIDSVELPTLNTNEVYARMEDGSFEITSLYSPGYPNTEDGHVTYLSRYTIQANDGSCRTLSVPLEGATNAMPVALRDVVISNHGRWCAEHWGALYSAYGRSPFFDYIAPELHRLLVEGKQHYLLELNNDLQQLVCEFADLPVRWTMLSRCEGEPVADLRRCTAGITGDSAGSGSACRTGNRRTF